MIKYLSSVNPKLLRGTALLRPDFNSEDSWRMEAFLPTVRLVEKHASKIVIVSHFGRPDQVSPARAAKGHLAKKFSLRDDAIKLGKLLHKKVTFIDHLNFKLIKATVQRAPTGSIFLLENIRFLAAETENSPVLAKQLAGLADFFVSDCFAVSHRANASFTAITKSIPSYAGINLENEIRSLSKVMMKAKHPLVIVLGGAKAVDKLGVIEHFKAKADWFLLGGGPANTILQLRGMDIKDSVCDRDPKSLERLRKIINFKKIVLPEDFAWRRRAILDLGPVAIKKFMRKIGSAKTVIWTGPMGLMEVPAFAKGTLAVGRAIAKNRRAFSVVGGGETVMFLKKHGLDRKISFISTGGGAMIDFLAGKKLPGIEALK